MAEIKVTVDGEEQELTVDQARQLYEELAPIFGRIVARPPIHEVKGDVLPRFISISTDRHGVTHRREGWGIKDGV